MQRDDWDQNWQNMNAAVVQHEALLRKPEQNPKKCMCCRPRVCAHRGTGSFRGLSWINEHSVEHVLIFTVSQHLPSQCMADIILRIVLLRESVRIHRCIHLLKWRTFQSYELRLTFWNGLVYGDQWSLFVKRQPEGTDNGSPEVSCPQLRCKNTSFNVRFFF